MSSQAIIATLLSVIGVLIMSWVVLASQYFKDRMKDKDERLDNHEDRIQNLEVNRVEEVVHREEMLEILRGLKNVG